MENSFYITIVGAGIVGLAVGLEVLKRKPGCRLLVLEKEAAVACHQTGHNSGVIHSGIYYKPGSLKARLCREGNRRLSEFCEVHGIRYEACGKVIVATTASELPLLENLYIRGIANGLAPKKLTVPEVTDLSRETPATHRLYGLDRPETADFGRSCLLARRLLEQGVRFVQIFAGGSFGSPRINWDGHEDMKANHGQEALRVDRPTAGLLRDLRQRGMLEDTLVLFTTEFGRTPFTQSAADKVGTGSSEKPTSPSIASGRPVARSTSATISGLKRFQSIRRGATTRAAITGIAIPARTNKPCQSTTLISRFLRTSRRVIIARRPQFVVWARVTI